MGGGDLDLKIAVKNGENRGNLVLKSEKSQSGSPIISMGGSGNLNLTLDANVIFDANNHTGIEWNRGNKNINITGNLEFKNLTHPAIYSFGTASGGERRISVDGKTSIVKSNVAATAKNLLELANVDFEAKGGFEIKDSVVSGTKNGAAVTLKDNSVINVGDNDFLINNIDLLLNEAAASPAALCLQQSEIKGNNVIVKNIKTQNNYAFAGLINGTGGTVASSNVEISDIKNTGNGISTGFAQIALDSMYFGQIREDKKIQSIYEDISEQVLGGTYEDNGQVNEHYLYDTKTQTHHIDIKNVISEQGSALGMIASGGHFNYSPESFKDKPGYETYYKLYKALGEYYFKSSITANYLDIQDVTGKSNAYGLINSSAFNQFDIKKFIVESGSTDLKEFSIPELLDKIYASNLNDKSLSSLKIANELKINNVTASEGMAVGADLASENTIGQSLDIEDIQGKTGAIGLIVEKTSNIAAQKEVALAGGFYINGVVATDGDAYGVYYRGAHDLSYSNNTVTEASISGIHAHNNAIALNIDGANTAIGILGIGEVFSDNGTYKLLNVENKGKITINNKSYLLANDGEFYKKAENLDALAIKAASDAEILMNNADGEYMVYGTILADDAKISLGGAKTLVSGDVFAKNAGIIDLAFSGSNSLLMGKLDNQSLNVANTLDANANKGTINLTLDNGATWTVTSQSTVDTLKGENGHISLNGAVNGGYALHVASLEGSHDFEMHLNPHDLINSDMLYVKTMGAQQQHLSLVNETELLNDATWNRVRFSSIKDSSQNAKSFGESYTIKDRGVLNVNLDIEYVDSTHDTNADNKLVNGDSMTDKKPGQEYVEQNYQGDKSQNVYLVRDDGNSSKKEVSDAGITMLSMSKANYANAVYMDRLNKRLGEARFVVGESGVWTRARHDHIGKEDSFTINNTMFNLGYNHASFFKEGKNYFGVAFDYMHGETDYKQVLGEGKVNRMGLWLYDSYISDDGHYADLVLKAARLDNDFDLTTRSHGEQVHGEYDNFVYSLSGEYGFKHQFGQNYYVEPQVQLQYAYVTDADYGTSQGTTVEVDSIHSLIGRMGFRLGHDFSHGTVYFKADALNEFLGKQKLKAYDNTGVFNAEYENKGTWFDVGCGCTYSLNKNSYIFVDAESSFGNDNESTYQFNLGVNINF